MSRFPAKRSGQDIVSFFASQDVKVSKVALFLDEKGRTFAKVHFPTKKDWQNACSCNGMINEHGHRIMVSVFDKLGRIFTLHVKLSNLGPEANKENVKKVFETKIKFFLVDVAIVKLPWKGADDHGYVYLHSLNDLKTALGFNNCVIGSRKVFVQAGRV